MGEAHISEPWFSLIKKRVKSVEGRFNKGDFAKMSEGDIVVSINKNDKVRTEIMSVHKYKLFNNYIITEKLKNTLPDGNLKRLRKELIYIRSFIQNKMKQGMVGN